MKANLKEIEILKRQLEKLSKISKNQYGYSVGGVQGWISSTISILERIFGKESLKIKEIRNISNNMTHNLYEDNYYKTETVNEIAESIINTCIDEIEMLGIPTTIYDGKEEKLNLTMFQQQSTSQQINLEIITKSLQNELNGIQLKELQEILDSKEDKENKKSKLVAKLKDFGINTLSSIISGILTNLIQI